MTMEADHRLRRIERFAIGVGAAALLTALVLGWRSPEGIAAAWRLAVFACLQPALGSLIFILIHRTTGGQWMEGLAPFLTAGARLLPWIWLLAIPLLWFPLATRPAERGEPAPAQETRAPRENTARGQTAPAATGHALAPAASRHLDNRLRIYFGRPMLAVRALVYAAAFFLFAAGASRVLRRPHPDTLRWFGPVGLIALVFILHLLATDWIGLLEPGWYSTGFALVWITGQALAGLAAATAIAAWFGTDPAQPGADRRRGLDWGNLLLASVMAWTYVAFVQWLIIWNGNLPAETAWYRHRSYGAWGWLIVGLALLEFAAPFALLLSRAIKRGRRSLALTAMLIAIGQLGYTIWLIAPALTPQEPAAWWLVACTAAAAAALFFNRYLAAARQAAGALAA